MTRERSSLAGAAHDGHWLALIVLALSLVGALLAVFARVAERRLSTPRVLQVALLGLVAVSVVGVLVAGAAKVGGPAGVWREFAAQPPKAQPNLNTRLRSFSGNGRAELWRVAWHDFEEHPVLGSGAGSFEQAWLRQRHVPLKVRDAHNLYLEELAELGLVGFGLLVAALSIPLVCARRARRHPLAPFAFGAYVAFLVHAGVDWDWELPIVVLAALACGVSLLVMGRSDESERRELAPRTRNALLVGTVVLMTVAFAALVGNLALAQSAKAAGEGNWSRSIAQAERAHRWAPWSSEPYTLEGDGRLALGQTVAAASSFHRAIAESPDDWSLWFDLARASSGNAQSSALARATELNPLSPEIAELSRELATQGSIGVAR